MKTKEKSILERHLVLALVAVVAVIAFPAPAGNLPQWKIVYGSAEATEGRAVELLTSDVGNILLREPGVYATHVLPAWRASVDPATNGNAFVIGTLADNPVLARYLKPNEVPLGGYLVRTVAEGDRDLVLIAGDDPTATLWGVADFLMYGMSALKPDLGNNLSYFSDVFLRGENRLGTFGRGQTNSYDVVRTPQTKVRSIFTWGHPIDDFRAYIRNMARLRLNRLYIWNNHPVLNVREIVDFAHSWGVEVYWGFAWGWGTNCRDNWKRDTKELAEEVLAEWRGVWRDVPGDGIYFQTFTECKDTPLDGGESIAARAVRLVNRVAGTMFAEKPEQKIVFGLHATGVRGHLAEIAATDPRLEILWEDTGYFPYDASGLGKWSQGTPEGDAAFTRRVLTNGRNPVGIVWKFQMIQDWTNWTYQEGPYCLGVTSRKTYDDDVAIQSEVWRNFYGAWISGYREAHAAARMIHAMGPNVEMNMAAQLNGPIRFPTVLVADLFWSSQEAADVVFKRALGARMVK